jgi:hypothetical protein
MLLSATKKYILTLVLSKKKNIPPPPMQVKWSVPKLLKPQQSKKYYTSGDNNNFQHIRNWIWWTINQRKTTTYFGRNSGSENKETLSSQCSRNTMPYSTPAISTSHSPLQNDLLLDEELVWIDYIFNC